MPLAQSSYVEPFNRQVLSMHQPCVIAAEHRVTSD